jgi:hypothetical protein
MNSSSDMRRRAATVLRPGEGGHVTLAPLDTDLRMASSVMRSIDPARIDAARDEARAEGFEDGRVEGFQLGLTEGRAAAAVEAAEGRRKLAAALTALREAAAHISEVQAIELGALEDQIVDVAISLAEAVIGRAVEQSDWPERSHSRRPASAPWPTCTRTTPPR